jgi:hypothetical protein
LAEIIQLEHRGIYSIYYDVAAALIHPVVSEQHEVEDSEKRVEEQQEIDANREEFGNRKSFR